MSKKKIIAIQADSLNSINIKTDTTFLLALEAQKRGNKIYWYQTKDLNFIKGKVYANVEDIRFYENRSAFYKILKKRRFDLSKANYLLIRQNPPFNMDYITSTFFLETISKTVKIINNPIAIRNISEKFYSINFLKFMPPTIFTKDIKEIKNFLKKNKKILIKPIHGYAGKDILFIKNKINISKVNKYMRKIGHVMVQKFLPKVKDGDKRVFISQGGIAVKTKLNNKEYLIAKYVAKKLKQKNIFFAGIDLISGYLIGDINVTSPTGLPQFKDLTGINLAKNFWDELQKLK